MTDQERALVALEQVENLILSIRGQKVMLDADLAALYGVETRALTQAVRRNASRFPEDFAFQLTREEAARLRSQFVISNEAGSEEETLRFQSGTSKTGRGGRRYAPYAFTEQGVAMLSSVLNSPRAVAVNIEIMRAFVQLRALLASNADLSRRLDELEGKYDEQFRVVFKAIRELMAPPPAPSRRLGFKRPESAAS